MSVARPGRPGQIVTFYSYKGGVGRSRALANTAYQLAREKKRVLCLDFDLEAPGLIGYFEKWDKAPAVAYEQREGLIDLFYSYKEYLGLPSPLSRVLDWKTLVHAVTIRSGDDLFQVDLIGPGRQTEDYGRRVTQFDWRAFYEEWEGGAFIEHLRELFRQEYDYVLLDSRTGLSDVGGICSIQFPTIVVVVFNSSPQGLKGLEGIVASIEAQHRMLRGDGPDRVPVIPLPSRIDRKEEKGEYEQWFKRVAAGRLGQLLAPLSEGASIETLLQRLTIGYVPWYSYRDDLESESESLEDVGANAWRYQNLVRLIYDAPRRMGVLPLVSIAEERIRSKLTDEENDISADLRLLVDLDPAAAPLGSSFGAVVRTIPERHFAVEIKRPAPDLK
jgi:cellulose biosynthesis protein BcsQ